MIPWQTIQEIARLKEEAELSEFEWSDDEFKVKLGSAKPAPAPSATADPETESVQGKKPRDEGTPDEDWVAIEAPMVGTFYEAPAPDADPFVEAGDKVTYSTTVCIIEAMKLMNEIEAECTGKIAQICKDDGESVSKGDTLFYVEPS